MAYVHYMKYLTTLHLYQLWGRGARDVDDAGRNVKGTELRTCDVYVHKIRLVSGLEKSSVASSMHD